MNANYLKELNEPQQRAVLHTDGPLMVIAGAGSGKTRVLTYKIAHLIQNGVDPFNILALTFTNKAAAEMRHRIEALVGADARNLWMGTFHSIFARILRIEAPKLGYPSNFTIYDTDDSKSLIKSIIKEMELDDKVYKPAMVLNRISAAKNNLISCESYQNYPEFVEQDKFSRMPKVGEIYQKYQARAFKAGAMDFDDLLYNTNLLFKNYLDILNKYQHKFKYILVDEYQDTNYSQYLITKKLAAVHRNLCVVGDDAQSIYAFRGATIQNILNYEKDYPECEIIRLEQNYRSTKVIVEAANGIIKRNKKQIEKNVWTDNPTGDFIEVLKAASDSEEGRLVAQSIFEEKVQSGKKNKDFAILYRTNAQSRALEEALRRLNLKYRIVGGLSFYQRKEIKDMLAYARLTVNTNDEEALKRIINYPRRGIGDTTISKMVSIAYDNDVPLWQVVTQVRKVFTGRSANEIEKFAHLINSFKAYSEVHDAFDTMQYIAKKSGLLQELHADKTPEGLSRYENVQELLNAVKEFTDNPNTVEKHLGAFLQEIALLTDEDRNKETDDSITLMTIHSAKGLEFKNVYIVGLEESLFPSQMMLESMDDLEEERRLFYVAVTRAQEKLTLSFATTRYKYGNLQSCEPSRFLKEISPKYLKITSKYEIEEKPQFKFFNQFKSGGNPTATPAAKAYQHTPSANFTPSDISKLKVGNRVEHQKFGFGTVRELDHSGPSSKARIQFDHLGDKTIILSFARLMIVQE
jgi:DNA helicase-2/ATP-dependent DNA helicase PcrA